MHHDLSMNGRLQAVAERQGGVFTTGQAIAAGYSQESVLALMRQREWHRLRRGAYVERKTHDSAGEVDRHVLQVRAVMLALGQRVAVSHVSALVIHGLSIWDVDLSRVHVTRVDEGAGRVHADVIHHCGVIDPTAVVRIDGIPVVGVARAVVENAATASFESGIVSADAALRTGKASCESLLEALDAIRSWPGAGQASAVPQFADGRAANVAESRARVLFHDQDLPEPELQHEFFDRDGRFVGRVDFYFPEHRTIVEFDGRMKYGGFGKDPAAVVLAEKRREDRLRELGFEVVRIDWSDLARPKQTAARIRQAFHRARKLRRN